MIDSKTKTQFQVLLLEWYDKSARILPWRDNPSPYRVWISEIMLQQTRVETVKPYFENFIREVPSIQDLANISEDKLLKLWEGLGYYSRAKNLKKAATIVLDNFGGIMPNGVAELLSLPGIGPYTSGAVASIAFGIKATAVDGNVLRVMARVTANGEDIKDQKVKQQIENTVKELLPEERVGDFNQALMELGATICIPTGMPKCELCPIFSICEGFKQGTAAIIPFKSKKKSRRIENKTILIINFKDRTAIRQRPSEGLLSSLWEFPHVEGHLSLKECEEHIKGWKFTPLEIIELDKSKHIFTHLEWHMIGYYISIDKTCRSPEFIWATRSEIKQKYSIPSAFKLYQKWLSDHL